ncbi:hypothetical protein [Hespellia stercorisuis]|uniref:Uncharacterized protein n=1 Tax=Hespellia stercorisuis DSM 15480 TaxID=1121950 RepID=A0A1M6REH9_9FIRM|nr:hypothetical protein [Hespellia stercorisuis]SHK30859.1 hypothetical protein SAMN02745243_02668 [Hespellia stercorisuis DSM 15480]
MNLQEKWKQECISHAKERFKNFRADFRDYVDFQTLDWRHESGRSDCHVHYIFDTKQQYMYISGDLGSACFYLTWQPTFKNMHNKIHQIEYVMGKIECSTDEYIYPEEMVKAELHDNYDCFMPDPDDYEKTEYYEDALQEWNKALEQVIYHTGYHSGFDQDSEAIEALEKIDEEWWDRNDFGKTISQRVYLWFMGLQMAWEEVRSDNDN